MLSALWSRWLYWCHNRFYSIRLEQELRTFGHGHPVKIKQGEDIVNTKVKAIRLPYYMLLIRSCSVPLYLSDLFSSHCTGYGLSIIPLLPAITCPFSFSISNIYQKSLQIQSRKKVIIKKCLFSRRWWLCVVQIWQKVFPTDTLSGLHTLKSQISHRYTVCHGDAI